MATFQEALRRAYHELVRRRSRVRIEPARQVALAHPPIFLIGVYGSGTTLLRYVVDSHSRICCPPETDFLTALAPLVEDVRCRAGLAGLGVDEEHALAKVRELAVYLFGNYAASWGKPRWADKSPAHVDCLDFLVRLFPDACFVTIFRHGLDQAHSFTRGGTFPRTELAELVRPGEDLRLGAVRYWCEKTAKMLDFEERHGERCHRLGYEQLCEQPATVLPPLFAFLGEAWEPGVLRFWEHPHDHGNEHGRVGATRGFAVRRDHFHGWSAELVASCLAVAAPTLARLGYPIDEVRSAR